MPRETATDALADAIRVLRHGPRKDSTRAVLALAEHRGSPDLPGLTWPRWQAFMRCFMGAELEQAAAELAAAALVTPHDGHGRASRNHEQCSE